jgi:hypothetical protein
MSDQENPIYELAGPAAAPPTSWCYWVVENRLLAGAYPGSPDADERRSKIQSLLDAGVRTIINLMEEDETNYQGQPFEPYDDMARELCPDVRFLRFAIQDLSTPSKNLMAQILDEIDHSTEDGSAAYVHCWGGVGRTGTVVACWLLRHQHAETGNVLDVLARLREKDQERGYRRSPETPEQAQFARSWSEGSESARGG